LSLDFRLKNGVFVEEKFIKNEGFSTSTLDNTNISLTGSVNENLNSVLNNLRYVTIDPLQPTILNLEVNDFFNEIQVY
jgi:hypothetical protein